MKRRREYNISLSGCMTKPTAEMVGRRYLSERMHNFPSSVTVGYRDVLEEQQWVTVEDDGARYVIHKHVAWLCLAAAGAAGMALGWAIAALIFLVLR